MKYICVEPLGANDNTNNSYSIYTKPDNATQRNRVLYQPEFTENLKVQVELVVKISKPGKYIPSEFAHNHFEQISLCLNFCASDLLEKLKKQGLPLDIATSFDGSILCGEFSRKEDWSAIDSYELQKNGKEVESCHLGENINNMNTIISQVSQYFTLKKGDVISSGSLGKNHEIAENTQLVLFSKSSQIAELKIL